MSSVSSYSITWFYYYDFTKFSLICSDICFLYTVLKTYFTDLFRSKLISDFKKLSHNNYRVNQFWKLTVTIITMRERDIDLVETYISTRSTLTPQGSVASSKELCMVCEMVSRSDRISAKFFVPKTFRNVVAANKRVEWLLYMIVLSTHTPDAEVKGGNLKMVFCFAWKNRH